MARSYFDRGGAGSRRWIGCQAFSETFSTTAPWRFRNHLIESSFHSSQVPQDAPQISYRKRP